MLRKTGRLFKDCMQLGELCFLEEHAGYSQVKWIAGKHVRHREGFKP